MKNSNIKTKTDINYKSKKTSSKDSKKINLQTIYDMYKTNFIDNCELILLEKQNNFLDKFFNKMKSIIKSEYDEDIFDKNKNIYEITKKCENDFISDVYWPMYDSCIIGYEKSKSSKINNNLYISNFLSHCNFEQIALHSCGSKFIQINSNINSKIYALCTGCKKCYFSTSIPVYCPFTHKKYYSKILCDEEKNYPPATWEEYHCKNPIINEQMTCIKCGDKFWIKKDKLFCKNCKFEVDPLLIIWTCAICKKEFKSKPKVYNPLEYKEIQNSIKEAILMKKIAKPNEVPCKCIKNNDIKNYDFNHKLNGKCKGVLYLGNNKNENILVCSLCNSFYPLNKFYWNCPICSKKFISNNININSKNNDNDNDFIRLKSEQNKKNTNLISNNNFSEISEKNSEHLSYKGTPIKELNSYVKKKPEDYYNYTNKNKDVNIDNKNKKRNLSITYTNKMNNNNDNECEKHINTNKNNLKDNKFNTNNYFYFKTSDKNNTKNRVESEENSKYVNKNLIINNEYFSPVKNEEKKYSKIQLTTKSTKKYQGLNDNKRYASTSTRNYHYYDGDNGEALMTEFNEKNNLNTNLKRYQKYSYYNKNLNAKQDISNNMDKSDFQVYIPKRKLDLNKNNNLISFLKEYNGNNNNKINNSNSVGIRERYKKINKKNNNFYEKRSLKTMIDDSNEQDNNNNNNDMTKKHKEFSGIYESKINKDDNKEIRSSSQIKIDKDKYKYIDLEIKNINRNKDALNEGIYTARNKENDNNLNFKHKYNKRYIGNKYNFNYSNINKVEDKNIYRKITNNYYNKEKNGTNMSNGADNVVINNIITNNDNNNDKIYSNTKKLNEDYINSLKREKKNYNNKDNDNNINDDDIKDINDKKYMKKQDNANEINKKININTDIRHSFKNGGNSIKEFDNVKIDKNKKIDKDITTDNDELKEFNFNDYKVITQLGQGTFGKIYLVQDKNNELFSMKKIILSEELDVQSVINEYKMCQKLKHSNVVRILGIYNNKLDTTTYVVYVLMEVGLTDWEKEIRKYNDKNLEYTERELIDIIKQLSSVLSFLQKNNISHRDIKPQNILVFKNKIYKVADFGEAKQIDNIAKNLINYSLRGTELYMSPLLFNGLRTGQIDIKHNLFKSDVYSLGLCILYAAVTNNKPLYDIRKYVDMIGIRKYLEKLLKGKYSQKFISLLASMLEIHEKNRPDFVELEKTMKKWK